MKCIKSIVTTLWHERGEIIRVSDGEALRLTNQHGNWQYCKKEEWKEAGR